MTTQPSTPEQFGRYQVVEELGSGAMGVVYLCVDSLLARPVAVKVLKDSGYMTESDREQYLARFHHEAEAAGRLTHPDIVQIYDIGPDYLVMEFIEGRPLSAALKAGERFTVREVCSLVCRVADAIDYAHRHGIVHRDIKPANIMLAEGGGVKVMDFGVARLESSNLTAIGTVVGSVRYMAPEQMMGHRVTGQADLFSLAAVAYELLTGSAPFPGKTITEVVARVVHGKHVPPRQADRRLPEELNGVFERAFAPRPEDRHAAAADFARELSEAARSVLDMAIARPISELDETRFMAPTVEGGATTTADTTLRTPDSGDGILLLESDPPGARVLLDGSPVGTTPVASLEVAFGRHEVRLEYNGREPVTASVEVGPERPVRCVTVSLEAADAARPGQFVEFGPGVTPPRRVAGRLPSRPPAARDRDLRGTSTLDVWISSGGDVVETAVVESAGAALDDALREAVRGWRFTPATRGGVPVAVRLSVQHLFR